jgi:hypothetical protein
MLDLEGRTMRLEREGRSKKRARREAARALLEAMGTCDGPS